MELVKTPAPVPSEDLLFASVGFWFELQQTPFAVTDPPLSAVILPPDTAVVCVIEVTSVVVNDGTITWVVVKET